MKKFNWLAASASPRVGVAALLISLYRWRTVCECLQPVGPQEQVPEEIYQTLLSNKKLRQIEKNL
jgi:hypothetical protein